MKLLEKEFERPQKCMLFVTNSHSILMFISITVLTLRSADWKAALIAREWLRINNNFM